LITALRTDGAIATPYKKLKLSSRSFDQTLHAGHFTRNLEADLQSMYLLGFANLGFIHLGFASLMRVLLSGLFFHADDASQRCF
jgi:hypothetical protein